MHPNHLIKDLLYMQAVLNECRDLFWNADKDVPFKLDEIDPGEVALSLIGFPEDNTLDFNYWKETPENPHKPDRRYDVENMFCRDELMPWIYDIYTTNTLDIIIDELYNMYHELVLRRPHLFVQAA